MSGDIEDILAAPTTAKTHDDEQPAFDVGYAGQQYRQSRIGLEMSSAQRLAWLERKKVEM